jgi:hypothetical protein
MTDWTDDERREFERRRHAGREHLASDAIRIRVGDRVATPGGPGWAIQERLDGFLVKLEADQIGNDGPAADDGQADDDVFYLPLELLRKLDP